MKSIIVLIGAFCVSGYCYSQTWLDESRRQQNMFRAGAGLQIAEPTGLLFQLYKGGFCSNDNTYANALTFEIVMGVENLLPESNRDYRNGKWAGGGFQIGANVLYPLYTLTPKTFTAQLHVGAGVQGGQRKYTDEVKETQHSDVFGGSLLLRLSITGRGFEIGKGLWFISYFVDAKYHGEFGEAFNYFRPSMGMVLRKAR